MAPLKRVQERVQALAPYGRPLVPTFRYWLETEVHVYAFSIAANVLLSFFPFLIVIVSFCKYVLHWHAAEQAVYLAMDDYFPGDVGKLLNNNLPFWVAKHRAVSPVSILLLLFTANGIFEPLEVALNRAWGIAKNRSFVKNQLISLGLIFGCGALALLSALLTAFNWEALEALPGPLSKTMRLAFYKMAAVPISIVILFMVYRLLPNGKVTMRQALPPAIIIGLLLEVLKYLNLLTLPLLHAKLQPEYGPFVNSATIILWSFVAALLVLAGAEWSAREQRAQWVPGEPATPMRGGRPAG